MDPETIKDELGPLTLKHAPQRERHLHEGGYHNGIGKVVQIIAVKT